MAEREKKELERERERHHHAVNDGARCREESRSVKKALHAPHLEGIAPK